MSDDEKMLLKDERSLRADSVTLTPPNRSHIAIAMNENEEKKNLTDEEKEMRKLQQCHYSDVFLIVVEIFVTVFAFSICVKLMSQLRMPRIKETFWTDENIRFWSMMNIPELSDATDETALRVYNEMKLFQQEAQLQEIKCVPLLFEIRLEDVLWELLGEQEGGYKMFLNLLNVTVPYQKVPLKQCPRDDICRDGVTNCLPMKDVRQGIAAIRMIVKNETLIGREMEEIIIEKALNGTFVRKDAAIFFSIEEHIHCACQCSCV